MKQLLVIAGLITGCMLIQVNSAVCGSYTVVDTGQTEWYGNMGTIACPEPGDRFYGQDAGYGSVQPDYTDNRDGTITDINTGLTWLKTPKGKMTYRQAITGASECRTAGYSDWRLPTIKELYSLIDFSGTDPDPRAGNSSSLKPFINRDYFDFSYGDPGKGERIIDSQFVSATKYVSTTMHGDETVFGVNFADGRIKGYGLQHPRRRSEKTFYVLYVRGNPDYGINQFNDNGDGTVTDSATGLTWMKVDSGHLSAGPMQTGAMNWEEALSWAENLEYAGYSDWRLPNAKELQSIVDYSRSPATTGSAAIDPVFEVSTITDEGEKTDYPFFWTGTTHAGVRRSNTAVYVSFGESPGWMRNPRTGQRTLLDVHGAGAQRSDPKAGDPSRFPYGRGPQGDVIRITNYVRCVRGG